MAKIFLDSNILIDFLVEERGALNLAAVKPLALRRTDANLEDCAPKQKN